MKNFFSIKYIGLFVSVLLGRNLSAQLNFDWVRQISGVAEQRGYQIANDLFGNNYIVGSFTNITDFDPGPTIINLTGSPSSSHTFIAKYDTLGQYIWAIDIGAVFSTAIDIDDDGSVICGGQFSSTVDFDPSPAIFNLNAGVGLDIFIAKYDSFGNFLWAENIGNNQNSRINNLIIDNHEIIATGYSEGIVDFDPSPSINNLGTAFSSKVTFLAKYDSLGNHIWAKPIVNSVLTNEGYFLDLDSNRNIFICGFFYGSNDFDPSPGVSTLTVATSSKGGFFGKYDSLGNYLFAKSISCGVINSIKVDEDLNIVIAGQYLETVDFDPGPGSVITSAIPSTKEDAFIAKYDAFGNYVWVKYFGSIEQDIVISLFVDHSGYTIMGSFQSTVDFDPSSETDMLTATGSGNTFFSKYNSSGDYLWTTRIKSTIISVGTFFKKKSLNEILLVGKFETPTDFDLSNVHDSLLISVGARDIFFVKYKEDLCYSFSIELDSIAHPSCSSPGAIIAHAHKGVPFYNYEINTIPVTLDSFAIILHTNIYTIQAYDDIGCFVSKDVLIQGPDTATGFDLHTSLVSKDLISNSTAHLFLDALNTTCIPVSGNLCLVLPSEVTFINSTPYPDYIIGDTLKWDFTYLTFDSLNITPKIDIFIPSTVLTGTILCFTSLIAPFIGDLDFSNNIDYNCFSVQNTNSIASKYTNSNEFILNNETMRYSIQFQNTSADTIFNASIIDTIDSNLDPTTLNLISSSHPVFIEFLDTTILKFSFNDIYLPDTSVDILGSTAYVVFEINQVPNLPDGIEISNTANIYFDSQFITATNILSNTIDLGVTITASNTDFCPGDSSLLTCIPNIFGLKGNWQWYANVCSGTVIGVGDSIWVYPTTTTTYFVKDSASINCSSKTITVLPAYSLSFSASVCPGDTMTFGTQNLFTPGTYNEPFSNVFGCDSIVTLTFSFFIQDSINQTATICLGDTLSFGTQQLFSPGVYNETFNNINGCDSVVNLTLAYSPVDITVAPSSITLTANATPATYQWLDCNTGFSVLAGETNQTFTATVNGNYAVIVTENGCSDTSACYLINSVGLPNAFSENGISVYPNPVSNNLNIVFGETISNATIQLLSITGQVVLEEKILNSNSAIIQTKDLENGIYYLQIKNGNEMFNLKIVKE